MLTPNANMKIFLCTGYTDMRKGVNSLSILASSLPGLELNSAIFVFRGKRADRLKILWWDVQGFCLFYKCMDSGKFVWPKLEEMTSLGITKAQLSMLIEGIDWRNPHWSEAPKYGG